MSQEVGKKIAEGGCSEIYEWIDDSRIIKIAKNNTSFHAMKREYENNLLTWENDLPVAKPYDFIEIDGRPGIIFKRIYGETLMERFIKKIMIQKNMIQSVQEERDIRLTARVLNRIHKKTDIKLKSIQRDNIKHSINSVDYLKKEEKDKITSILDELPRKEVLCHGDPNPGNILVKENNEIVIIDWMDATIGNPEADLAEYIIMIRYAILPSHIHKKVSEQFDLIREDIINIFMDEYGNLSGITYEEVQPWIVPIAARKLSADAISEDEKKLLVEMIRCEIG